MYGDLSMEIAVSVSTCPFYAHVWRSLYLYAHVWRSLYLSVLVPFMPMYGDRCICQSLSLLCPCMEIAVSVSPCPFYAHVWRSLYLSVLVPFMPMYGDRCICQSLSLLCPCMEISVSVLCPCM